MKRSPGKFPATVGACVDRLQELEDERAGLMAQIKLIDDAYLALDAHVIKNFSRQQLDGAQGKLARCELRDVPLPTVEDWDIFYGYIVKHKAWELLQKRVGVQAWRERLDNGVIVPGTKVFNKLVLKLTAIRKRRRAA